MIQYSIEELHQLFVSNQLDWQSYYDELFKEVDFQQNRLNAFATITKDEVYKNLKQTYHKGLLNGIPYVLKDNFNTVNIKTTASSQMLDSYVPIYNAHVVERLSQCGTCLVGKTSMNELSMGDFHKPFEVCNPWDCTRIAKSSGSAALVGSGVVVFAIGTDTEGSFRKSAGYCGVVGFKPTWGRVSRYGVIPYASSFDTVGALTRNIRDMAIVIEAISGRDDHDMTSSFKEVPHYLENLNEDIHGIKIAVLKQVSDVILNPHIKNNFDFVIQTLKDLGAKVEEVTMPQNLLENLLAVQTIIANGEATSLHACLDGIKYGHCQEASSLEEMIIQSRTQGFEKKVKQRFILGNLALLSENQEKMFKKAQRVRRLIVNELNKLYKDYDIILTPNSGTIAPKSTENIDESNIIENHLCLANFAGTPSLTMPCGFVDKMPIAVNLTGRLFEEQTVLNVAYALENVLGYKNQFKREG